MFNDAASPDSWSRLSLFTSREVLERKYHAKHARQLSTGKAKEIISHLEQARQYFESAESAGVLAGPLELYYGVLAFCRAIVLLRSPAAREATLKKGHGLHTTLSGDSSLDQIDVRIEAGTFEELLDATGNTEQIEIPNWTSGAENATLLGDVRFLQALPRPANGDHFRLLELLGRIPRVRQLFGESLAVGPNCHEGWARVMLPEGKEVSFTIWADSPGRPSVEELRQSLGLPDHTTLNEQQYRAYGSIEMSIRAREGEASVYSQLPHIGRTSSWGHSFVERYPGGWSLSRLASYFAASHILSALVRYHPTRWAELVNHERDDRLLPVISETRRLIQSEFAALVLEELER